MFSYESQREGSTFGHGDATRGFHFGALYCSAAKPSSGTKDGTVRPTGEGPLPVGDPPTG